FECGALLVKRQAPSSAELFAAAGATWTSVDQLREHGAGRNGLARDLGRADEDPAVVRGDAADEVLEESAIVGVRRGDQSAGAAAHQGHRFPCLTAVVADGGGRAKDLEGMDGGRTVGPTGPQQCGPDEVALAGGRQGLHLALTTEHGL